MFVSSFRPQMSILRLVPELVCLVAWLVPNRTDSLKLISLPLLVVHISLIVAGVVLLVVVIHLCSFVVVHLIHLTCPMLVQLSAVVIIVVALIISSVLLISLIIIALIDIFLVVLPIVLIQPIARSRVLVGVDLSPTMIFYTILPVVSLFSLRSNNSMM